MSFEEQEQKIDFKGLDQNMTIGKLNEIEKDLGGNQE